MNQFKRVAALAFATVTLSAPLAIRQVGAKDAPITHRVIGQDRGQVTILSKDGQVEWQYPCGFTSHDIAALPNGNFLLHTGPATLAEVTPEKKIVWQYTAAPVAPYTGAVEIHGFGRLKDGTTFVAETGNKRIVEVDKDGKILRSTPLTVDNPNAHRDTRLVRRTDKDTYLVCHEGDGMVREYDLTGKVIWQYKMDLHGQPRTPNHDGHGTEVFSAVRLKNGNTLIGGGNNNRVFEVTPQGETVWSIERDELPGIHLCWITTVELLPNNHIVFGNTHAGPSNPQLIEVTHDKDKKVVWTMNDQTHFGNDLAAAQVLDVKGKVIR